MIEKVDALIRQLVQEEREKKEMELEVLRAQINPHFLYNSLNTIRLMAKIQGDKSIAGAITALIKLLRISVDLGRDLIVQQDEIEYVKTTFSCRGFASTSVSRWSTSLTMIA